MFLQLSKAELLLHYKNVEMFPTFWKCRNISSIIQMCFCSCQKLNCSYILKKCRNVSYILEMQEYFLHFSNVFLQLPKAELFLHLKNAEMFPTFWKCRNISSIIQMYFCSCQKLNCSYILEMFLHFRNAGIFPTFFQCVSAVAKS